MIGIGSTLKGDDGIGTIVAQSFSNPGWISFPSETMPENFLGKVRKEKPKLVVLIDAADMGLEPGSLRLLGKENLSSAVVGTHGLPLKHLVKELEAFANEVVFIGVQPDKMLIGEELSQVVAAVKEKLVSIVKERRWNEIELLT